ncbi:MAG: hypothetical protein AB1847_13455 [bacterium]
MLESLGYQLHNLYCAFEDFFKIVARYFESQVKDISRYPKELLRRISLPVEGVRPRLISEESYRELDDLRAFRHFFRHAYSYALRYEKVKIPMDSARRLQGFYKRDIAQFLDNAKTAISGPSPRPSSSPNGRGVWRILMAVSMLRQINHEDSPYP